MAFKGFKYDVKAISDATEGNNIQTSGLYTILMERLEYKETENDKYLGGVKQEFVIAYDLNGKKGNLFGLGINKIDGDSNLRTTRLINNLLTVIKWNKDLPNPVKSTITRANGDSQEVKLFKELSNKKVIVQIKAVYSKYNNKIYKNLQIQDFFDEQTKASASEIINDNKEFYGQRFNKINDKKYASQVEYQGVTKEEADEWEEAQKNKQSNNNSSTIEINSDEIPF